MNLKTKYGITLEQYSKMLVLQGNRCALCYREAACGKRLHLDHDHKTGIIRGLLCHQCNWYLGIVDKDPSILERIKLYLERGKDDRKDAI